MRSYDFVFDTKVIQCHYIFHTLAFKSVEVLHREYIVLVPFQFKSGAFIDNTFNMTFVQEIVDLFFVNLEVTTVNGKLLFAEIGLLLDHIEEETN